MSLMPFKGRCIHCGYDHGNSDFYGDDPIRYQDRLKAQATLEKVAVHVLEQQIATLTRQRDLAVEALEAIAGRRIFIDSLASNVDIAVMTLDAIKESDGK